MHLDHIIGLFHPRVPGGPLSVIYRDYDGRHAAPIADFNLPIPADSYRYVCVLPSRTHVILFSLFSFSPRGLENGT